MKQFVIQIIALLLVIFLGLWVSTNPAQLNSLFSNTPAIVPTSQTSLAVKKLIISSESGAAKANVSAEVADTADKRALGLGGRASLEVNSGMLFLFDKPGVYSFYMKAMKIPLDIIWIRGDTVVGVEENVPPPTGEQSEELPIYTPPVEIDKVLEVNSGFVKLYHIGTGDKIKQVQ